MIYIGYVTVYIDLLFLINFVMNCLVFFATARLIGASGGRRIRKWRVAAGGALSAAVYTLSFLFGFYGVFGFLLNIPGFLGGLLVIFAPISLRRFINVSLTAFGLTIVLGGGSLAAYFSLGMDGIVPIWLIAGASIIMTYITTQIVKRVKTKALQKSIYKNLRISLFGQCAKLTALVDTGHRLIEPLSGKSVVVAELSGLIKILPDKIVDLFTYKMDADMEQAATAFADAGVAERFHIVPYKSIGKELGVLVAFRPCEVIVDEVCVGVIIAIYDGKIGTDFEYNALIGTDFIEN
ncbi:MAG: sigma-E processing peptidase SpoIIGA [Defluviitaleaceae bacterium]|nr:sigma-E processing peptidase SpoIIGA [Defluviitaleaceae bacterium]